jgi:hypothetical protein
LDEYMLAGEIEETSKREILDRVKLLEKMEWVLNLFPFGGKAVCIYIYSTLWQWFLIVL